MPPNFLNALNTAVQSYTWRQPRTILAETEVLASQDSGTFASIKSDLWCAVSSSHLIAQRARFIARLGTNNVSRKGINQNTSCQLHWLWCAEVTDVFRERMFAACMAGKKTGLKVISTTYAIIALYIGQSRQLWMANHKIRHEKRSLKWCLINMLWCGHMQETETFQCKVSKHVPVLWFPGINVDPRRPALLTSRGESSQISAILLLFCACCLHSDRYWIEETQIIGTMNRIATLGHLNDTMVWGVSFWVNLMGEPKGHLHTKGSKQQISAFVLSQKSLLTFFYHRKRI